MLAKSPHIANYTLCEFRSWLTRNCSTHFNVSTTTGARLGAHCEDPYDDTRYLTDMGKWNQSPSWDWKNIADQWHTSLALNGGIENTNASNARILTQLILQSPELPAHLPSLAEALAVFVSPTLMISSLQTVFDYNDPGSRILYENSSVVLDGSHRGTFGARIQTVQYASYPVENWHWAFCVVLFAVPLLTARCLYAFYRSSGLVTDMTEPQHMFALAINSPPSEQMYGTCGPGPEDRDFTVPWRIKLTKAEQGDHYYFDEASKMPMRGKYKTRPSSFHSGMVPAQDPEVRPSMADFSNKRRSQFI